MICSPDSTMDHLRSCNRAFQKLHNLFGNRPAGILVELTENFLS